MAQGDWEGAGGRGGGGEGEDGDIGEEEAGDGGVEWGWIEGVSWFFSFFFFFFFLLELRAGIPFFPSFLIVLLHCIVGFLQFMYYDHFREALDIRSQLPDKTENMTENERERKK